MVLEVRNKREIEWISIVILCLEFSHHTPLALVLFCGLKKRRQLAWESARIHARIGAGSRAGSHHIRRDIIRASFARSDTRFDELIPILRKVGGDNEAGYIDLILRLYEEEMKNERTNDVASKTHPSLSLVLRT